MRWIFIFFTRKKALLAYFHFWLVLERTIVPKSVLQPNLSYKIIFLFAYSHWDLGVTRSDPPVFPQDSTHPHKKLGLYDNENVRVLVLNIDWVFFYKSCQTMNYAVFEFLGEIKPGGYSLEFWVGVCVPSSQNPDPILDILDQENVSFHTGFIPGL